MIEPGKEPGGSLPDPGEPGQPVRTDPDAWKTVYFGQLSRDLVPYHPDPPEAPEDELTRAALEDPAGVNRGEPLHTPPTLWRLLAVLAVAVAALGLVLWRTH